MRLGNSNGNNKGKKYFVRGRDDQNLDILYAEKAEEFAEWFSLNMMVISHQILNKGRLDEDVFNDTYLRMYEIIMFTGRKVKDYASYFHRAYYTNFIQGKTKDTRYCELYPNYDVEDNCDKEYFEEIEEKSKILSDDILDYVYKRYEIHEFEIFKMYVNLKPAVNYHSLAKMTDSKYHVVQRLISSIISDIRSNTLFSKQRKYIARIN